MTEQERIDQLEGQLREVNRTLVGIQQALLRASRFKHEDPQTQVDGIQILLAKAAEYQPRKQQKGRRG